MKNKKSIILIICILLISAISLYNAFYINPKQFKVNNYTIESEKISKELDGLKILFFTDLHYGTSIKINELNQLVEKINDFDTDILIFGGDLVDHFSLNALSEEEEKEFTDALKKIDARMSKFAVLGNHDLDSPIVVDNVNRILSNADFELVYNDSVKIKNGDSYLNIVGIDSMLLGKPDVIKAYEKVNENEYTLTVCHTPDIFDELPLDKTDLVLAGHSHGGQIYIPYIVDQILPMGSTKYYRDTIIKDNTRMDISNGVGTTQKEIRLFADASFNIYKFKHIQKVNENIALEDETPKEN